MSEYPDLDELFHLQWASQRSSQRSSQLPGTATSHGDDETPLPEPGVPSRGPNGTPQALSQYPFSHQEKLSFLEEKEWDPHKSYDDRFHYLIEWKATLNGKAFTDQSEPNVPVSLGCYWQLVLQDRLRQAVRRKFAASQRERHKDTTVAVSVTDRSQRDLKKEFEGTEINWAVADKQLLDWSPYFQKGKRLRVNLSFNFVEANAQSSSRSVRRGDKRGRTSATDRMLAERDRQIEAEREATGREPIWPKVHAFLRCQRQSCESWPHCWIDSDGKHYNVNAEHLRMLVEYTAEHGMPESHKDIPQDLKDKLIAKDKERRDLRGKQAPNSGPSLPPINITNVLPGHPQQTSESSGERGCVTSENPSDAVGHQQLKFSGLRDDMLREYAMWHQSKVRDPLVKAEFGKAYDVALKRRLFLERLYVSPNPDIFIKEDVSEGVAWYFCYGKDIENFSNQYKRPRLDGDGN